MLRISLQQQFDRHQAETWDLRFSPDGQRLISSDGQALYLWRHNGCENWIYERSFLFRHALYPCFAPDGQMLAFRDQSKQVRLLSLEGKEMATLPVPAQTNGTFSPDHHWFVTGDSRRNVLLWNLLTFEYTLLPLPFPGFKDSRWDTREDLSQETIRALHLTPDGQRLIFGAASREGYLQICFLDTMHKHITAQKTFPLRGIIDLAISPNGSKLAVVSQDEVYVYQLNTLHLLQKFARIDKKRYCLLTFSPNSKYVASSTSDGDVVIWSLEVPGQVATFAAHPGLQTHATDAIGGLDWSQTGLLATAGASSFEDDPLLDDYTVKLWKMDEVEDE